MGNELLTFSTGFVMLGGGVDVDVVDVDVRRGVEVNIRRGVTVDVRRSVDVGGAIVVSDGVEDTGGEATCDYVRSTLPLLGSQSLAAADEGAACRFL